jgi:replicative DNA helicase
MGKTALAMNIATNVAANQKTVVVFSLEMTNEEIGKRMMSSAMTKSVKDIIRSRQLTDSDKQQLDRALLKMREYPIYFDESVDINPVTMKAKIQQLAASGNPPKLVIVDYLQLIELKGLKGRSRNDEVATISRGLKLLAKEFRIPVIALSQLSRKADGQVPKLSELRDSGAIEQDADTVMFVHRPNYIEDNGNTPSNNAAPATSIIGGVEAEPAYIFLAKNRHGQVGKDTVWWIPSKTLFYEHSEKDPVDPDSPYARTANADAAAQKYDFDEDKDDEQVMDPPLSEDESAGQAEEEFMADTHDDLPDGFFDEHM